MKSIWSLALVLVLLVPPVFADDGDALAEQVQELLDAPDVKTRRALIDELIAAKADVATVAGLLAKGRTYAADVPKGWLERTNLCIDGVERNYLLFVPEDYTPEKSYRLLVHLHGGISRPAQLTHEQLEQTKFYWGEHAEEHGYLHAIPAGQQGAEWWQPIGVGHVLDIVRTVKREYRVDPNQVLMTGFSDGASGSFFFALAHPTPFAGFIPLSGHVGVAGVRGFQVHLRNLLNKPIWAANTEKDSLYPSAGVKPFVEAMKNLGVKIEWRDIPEFTHNPMYLPDERAAIAAWMDETRRVPHPQQVVWEGDAEAPSKRVHWLQVKKVADVGNDIEVADVNPMVGPGRVLIGINVDQEFDGQGVRVARVNAGSPAQLVGLEEGDVIVELDGKTIAGLDDLREVLGTKSWGDKFTIRFTRDEESAAAEASFPKPDPRPGLRRERPWGHVHAVIEGNTIDVQVKRIGAFDLYLAPEMVDFAKPVVVRVNGKVLHEGPVEPDLSFLLSRWLEDEDPTMLYHARLHIEVPGK